MAVVLALTAAVSWGASDFLGGLAGRRSPRDATVAITLISSFIGFLGLTVVAAVTSTGAPPTGDLVVGTIAGLGGAVGVALLYRGLRVGKMGVAAPTTGAGGAPLPVIYGALTGEQPSALAWVGVVVALIAIVLVSREPTAAIDAVERPARGLKAPGVPEAIGAGIGFAAIFILLDQTGEASGLWPLVPMKAASTVLMLVVGLAASQPLTLTRPALAPVIGVGLLDNAANAAYLLATRVGLLAIVAVVSSLYPVITVVLARGVLDEHLRRAQVAGLALALVAIALITLG